jgi:DNA-binding NarL/FixJ family response regulator
MSVSREVSPRPLKALVVSSQSGESGALAAALEQGGFNVRSSWLHSKHLPRALNWRPDVVVLEVSEDLAFDREIFEITAREEAPIVVLARRLTPESRAEFARLGVASMLSKQRPFDEILDAIVGVLERARKAPRRRRSSDRPLRTRESDPNLDPFGRLTPREQEVLASLIDGVPASVIAIESSVAVSTVRTQIRSILQKLGVNSQLRAVSLARKAGWPNPDDKVVETNPSGGERMG